jgi:F0F1-type ATP synthase epsilon subunit
MDKFATKVLLHVRISAASSVLWEGEAYSVTSENSDGRFDILGLHSNFITLIRDVPIVITLADGTVKEFTFQQSVIHVTDNHVKIFADIQYTGK